MNINELAKEIHAENVAAGWWPEDACIYTKLQLVSTEIAEATEAERKDLMDEKLPHRKGGEVELADAMIRVLDIGGYLECVYLTDVEHYTFELDFPIAGKHLMLNRRLCELSDAVEFPDLDPNVLYSYLVNGIITVAESQDYDLWGAVEEKRAYNKRRKDHKLSERAKPGGKKF